jgi:hypothetical protein
MASTLRHLLQGGDEPTDLELDLLAIRLAEAVNLQGASLRSKK